MYSNEFKGFSNIHQKPSYHSAMDAGEIYIAKVRDSLNKPIEQIVIPDNEFSDIEEIFKYITEIEFEDNEVEKEECEITLEDIVDRELEDKSGDKSDNYYEKPRIP